MRGLDAARDFMRTAGEVILAAASGTEKGVWTHPGWEVGWGGGAQASRAGTVVTSNRAMNLSVFYACIKILSESDGRILRNPFRELGSTDREVARDLPLFQLLQVRPNRFQTPYYYQQTGMVHRLMSGNSVSEIVAGGPGAIREVVPLNPQRLEILDPETAASAASTLGGLRALGIEGNDGDPPIYRAYDWKGRQRILTREEVLHVPMLGSDGRKGMSVLQAAKEALGTGLAQAEFSGSFFSKGLTQRGVLQHPKHISPKAKKQLEDQLAKQGGISGAGGILILQEDMKFFGISVNPQDAELLDSQRFTVEQIARFFSMPLAKLGAQTQGFSYASVEQFLLDYGASTMEPYLVGIDQEWNRAIPGDAIYVESDRSSMKKGDIRSTWAKHAIAINTGVYSPEYARFLESIPESAAPAAPAMGKGDPSKKVDLVPPKEAQTRALGWDRWEGRRLEAEKAKERERRFEVDASRMRGLAAAASRALARGERRFLEKWKPEYGTDVAEGFYRDFAKRVAKDLALPEGTALWWADGRANALLRGTEGEGFDLEAFKGSGAGQLEKLALQEEGERDVA